MNLTEDILKKIAPNTPNPAKIAEILNRVCPLYGINSSDIMHEFIANLIEESGEFTRFEENLNYSSDSIIKIFSRARISVEQAQQYGRNASHHANKQAIANTIYGGPWGLKNLGNSKSTDGWAFRGGGAIQLTGRSNYQRFTNYYNSKFDTKYTAEQMAQLVMTNMEMGISAACWYYAIAASLIDESIKDQFDKIVRVINGGMLNYPTRLHYYHLAEQYIKD